MVCLNSSSLLTKTNVQISASSNLFALYEYMKYKQYNSSIFQNATRWNNLVSIIFLCIFL